jgi:hypothetical protein
VTRPPRDNLLALRLALLLYAPPAILWAALVCLRHELRATVVFTWREVCIEVEDFRRLWRGEEPE